MVVHHLKRFFESSEIMFLLAIVLPFFFGESPFSLKFGIELCLGLVMFFSIRPFLKHRFELHKHFRPMAVSIFLNYVLLSLFYVMAAYLLFGTGNDFFTGYLMMAIVPPAIAIIPLCYLSKCDIDSADAGIFVSFAMSLVIIPLTVYLVFGKSVDFLMLFKVILLLIVIPVFLAYLFRHSSSKFFSYSKAATNICLALVIFISTSFNKAVFFNFSDPAVVKVYIINALGIFGLGILVYHVSKWLLADGEAINYSLYASQKNVGTSITLGIFLFNPKTAVPAIIALLMQFVYLIVFEELFVKRRKE
jgi:predicted Na+-dependent transporter